MSRRGPKAHVYLEGLGGMVTGTHDVELARKLMQEELLDYIGGSLDELIGSDVDFTTAEPGIEIGSVIPVSPTSSLGRDGYAWLWKGRLDESALGTRGVTRAVVWNA